LPFVRKIVRDIWRKQLLSLLTPIVTHYLYIVKVREWNPAVMFRTIIFPANIVVIHLKIFLALCMIENGFNLIRFWCSVSV
jgi:hypothetical protein